MQTQVTQYCHQCRCGPAFLPCTTGCMFVYYCSTQCQEKDSKYKEHSKTCGSDWMELSGNQEEEEEDKTSLIYLWEAVLPHEMAKLVVSFMSPMRQQMLALTCRTFYARLNCSARGNRLWLLVETWETLMEDEVILDKLAGLYHVEELIKPVPLSMEDAEKMRGIGYTTQEVFAFAVKQDACGVIRWLLSMKIPTRQHRVVDDSMKAWVHVINNIIKKHNKRNPAHTRREIEYFEKSFSISTPH